MFVIFDRLTFKGTTLIEACWDNVAIMFVRTDVPGEMGAWNAIGVIEAGMV